MTTRTIRFGLIALAAFAMLLTSFSVQAQIVAPLGREPAPFDEPLPELAGEGASTWEKYKSFWIRELEKVVRLDPYGVSSQLPKGYMSIKWQWDMIKAGHRYNDRRKLGPVMNPIEFSLNGEKQLSADLGITGSGGGHTFQISYGITDPLDWYIEIPFQYMDVSFNPSVLPVDDEGNYLGTAAAGLFGVTDRKGYSASDFMCKTMKMLGRPTPGMHYKGSWMLGDINTGFSWNVFRNSRFSMHLTPRVFLPTGRVPDPNDSLTYGAGPEIENGIGCWAVSFTNGWDLRLFKYKYYVDIILSTEFSASYAFQQSREYPTNFGKPDPLASQLDPMSFPDLSDLDGQFRYTPGFGVSWLTQLNVSLFGIGAFIGFGVNHNQMPEIAGDRDFINMVKSLELIGSNTLWAIEAGVSVSLIPLFIPLEIGFKYRKIIDGMNALVFDDYFILIVKGYIPINPS